MNLEKSSITDARGFQVRFWCKTELFHQFKRKAQGDGFKLKDLFKQFMIWYLSDEEVLRR